MSHLRHFPYQLITSMHSSYLCIYIIVRMFHTVVSCLFPTVLLKACFHRISWCHPKPNSLSSSALYLLDCRVVTSRLSSNPLERTIKGPRRSAYVCSTLVRALAGVMALQESTFLFPPYHTFMISLELFSSYPTSEAYVITSILNFPPRTRLKT